MINRRQFLTGMMALGASQVAAAGMKFLPNLSIHNPCLVGLPEALQQHPLMQEIWDGIDPSMMWDSHVHLTGVGDSEAGIWVNPNMNSFLHPILKLQKHFYMNGGCVNEADIDQSYKNRLLQLANEMPPGFKTMLFAFDWYHDEMGQQDKNHSIFHVANDYAANLAKENPERFEWVASIHPYRADAVDALDQAYAQGARAVKWIPSGMGIDPASKKCDAFYVKVAQLKMPIISHAGHEAAVQGGNQSFGNPLKMRNALDQGVKVVLAHCASDGEDEDLDLVNKPKVKSLALFTRMMEQDEYQQNLYGEISALPLINHADSIKKIIVRTDWEDRLLNGSDYPLVGVVPLISLTGLQHMQLIKASHHAFLRKLRKYNPLMFDFALKRLVSWKGHRFSNTSFETRRFFDNTLNP